MAAPWSRSTSANPAKVQPVPNLRRKPYKIRKVTNRKCPKIVEAGTTEGKNRGFHHHYGRQPKQIQSTGGFDRNHGHF